MKCQSCGKREASVKYYENINGNKQTLYFCVDCAKKLGFSDFNDFSSFSNFQDFSNFFTPIFTTMPEFDLLEQNKCSKCGYTLDDYYNTGMLGCEECYKAFEKNLDDLFYKINGKNRHIKLEEKKVDTKYKNKVKGENLDGNKNENSILKLKEKLEKLVKEEKYEEAAVIRDEIKKLKEDK